MNLDRMRSYQRIFSQSLWIRNALAFCLLAIFPFWVVTAHAGTNTAVTDIYAMLISNNVEVRIVSAKETIWPYYCVNVGLPANNGNNVQKAQCDGSVAQDFIYTPWLGVIQLKQNSDYCLDVSGGNSGYGTNFQLHQCNGSLTQRFDYNSRDLSFRSRLDSRMCLEFDPAGNLYLWGCFEENTNQQFRLSYDTNELAQPAGNLLELRSHVFLPDGSQGCVDIENWAAAVAGDNARLLSCDLSAAQRFIYDVSAATLELASNAGFCLNVLNGATTNGTNIELAQCDGSTAQKFDYEAEFSVLRSRIDNNKCVESASFNSAANIQLFDCHFGPNQRFTMGGEYTASNPIAPAYEINSLSTVYSILGYNLPASWVQCFNVEGTPQNGANINLWKCNESSSQKFIYDSVRQTFQLAAAPRFCLDLDGGNTSNGTNIKLWECSGSTAQRFEYSEQSLTSLINTQKCINADGMSLGGNVYLTDCNNVSYFQYLDKNFLGVSSQLPELSTEEEILRIVSHSIAAWPYRCLSIEDLSASAGDNARGEACSATAEQDFIYNRQLAMIQFKEDPNFCLAVGNSDFTDGANIQLEACDGSEGQRFTYTADQEFRSFLSAVDSNGQALSDAKCIDLAASGNMQLINCTPSSPNKKFKLEPVTAVTELRSGVHPTECVDIENPTSIADGNNARLATCDQSAGQKFVYDAIIGSLKLEDETNYCLDVDNSQTDNGTNIRIYNCNGTDAQRFGYDLDKKVFRSKLNSNKCIDVEAGQSGGSLVLYDCHYGSNQVFDNGNGLPASIAPTTMTGNDDCFIYNPDELATGSGDTKFGVEFDAKGCGKLMKDDLLSLEGEGVVAVTVFGHKAEVFKLDGKRGVTMAGEIISEGGPKLFGKTVYIPKGTVSKNKRKKSTTQKKAEDTSRKALKDQRENREVSPKKLMKQAVALLQAAVNDRFDKSATKSAWSAFQTSRACPSDTPIPAVMSGILIEDYADCVLFKDFVDSKKASKSNSHPASKLLRAIAKDYGNTNQKQWLGSDFAGALHASLKKVDRYESIKDAIAMGAAIANDLTSVSLPALSLPTDRLPLIGKGAEVSIQYTVFVLSAGVSADVGIATELEVNHSSTTVDFGNDYSTEVPLPFDKPSVAIGPYASASGFIEAEAIAGFKVGGVDVSVGGAGVRGELMFIESTFKPTFEASLFKDSNANFKIQNEIDFLDIAVEAYVYYYALNIDTHLRPSRLVHCPPDYTNMGAYCGKPRWYDPFGWGDTTSLSAGSCDSGYFQGFAGRCYYECADEFGSGYINTGEFCQGANIGFEKKEHAEPLWEYDSGLEHDQELYNTAIDISF